MSRSRIIKTLLTATTCGGLVLGQAANPTPPLESRVGKVITVQEVNRPAEKCIVQQVWCSPEGLRVMKAQVVASGAMITIVERPNAGSATDRFRVFHWVNGLPPQGCPLPPDMHVTKAPAKESKPEKKDTKESASAPKAWPAAHSTKKETASTKPVEVAAKEDHPKTADAPAPKEHSKSAAKPADQEIIVIKAPERVAKPTGTVKIAEPESITAKPTPNAAKSRMAEKPAEKPMTDKALVQRPVKAVQASESSTDMMAKPVGTGENKATTPGDHFVAKTPTASAKPLMPHQTGDRAVANAPAELPKPSTPPQPEHIGSSPYGGPAAQTPAGAAEHVTGSPYAKDAGASKGAAAQKMQPPKSASTTERVTGSPYTKDVSSSMSMAEAMPMPKPPVARAGGDFVSRSPNKSDGMPSAAAMQKGGDFVSRNVPAKPIAPSPAVESPRPQLTPPTTDAKQPAASELQSPRANQLPDDDRKAVTLKKPDGSSMKCMVLSEGVRADGSKIVEVKVIGTGEVLTIVEEVHSPMASGNTADSVVHRNSLPPTLADSGKPSYMQPTATMPPVTEAPRPKPSFVQRVRDRIHGSDRIGNEPPQEKVMVSQKTGEVTAAAGESHVKKEDMNSADKTATAQLEPPRPAGDVDWHKSWGSDSKAKATPSIAKTTTTDPLLNQDQYLRPGKTKSVETAQKVEPPLPIAETKSVETKESTKAATTGASDSSAAVASKTEAGIAPKLTPPIQVPAVTPTAPERPQVAAALPAVAEAKAPPPMAVVPPLPVMSEPKTETPKVVLAPLAPKETKPAEPILPEAVMEPSGKMPAPPAPQGSKVAEMKLPVIEKKPVEAKPQDQVGLVTIASGKDSRPALLNERLMAGSDGVGMAQTMRMPPKHEAVDPEFKKQQAIKYTAVLMELLQNSGVPGEREMAAIQLRNADTSTHPLVMQALLQAAKNDSAPVVRIAAMQSLTAMKMFTPEVKAMLEDAATERDPRVRDEAKLSLSLMSKPPEVRPTGYRR